MHGAQLSLKHMGQGGLVVNVASLGGLTPTPTTPAYGASKAAVVAYTRYRGQSYKTFYTIEQINKLVLKLHNML